MEQQLEKLVYTIPEAMKVSTLGRTSIYRHIKDGRLKVVHLGGRVVIPATNLKKFLGLLEDGGPEDE